MNVSPKKVIKPFYNARQASRLQACAKELHEQQSQFQSEQAGKTKALMEQMNGSTFRSIKTKAVLRREANQAKRKAFNEALTSMIAVAAYNAMPVDGKEALREDAPISEQPQAFQKMYEVVSDFVTKDSTTSMMVGDSYARSSSIDLGSATEIKASQMAISIAGTISAVREQLSDNPNAQTYTVQNYLDNLLTFGDIDNGETKQKGNITIAEQVYEDFVRKLTEDVETKVISALKVESEKAEMLEFLEESYKEDKYSNKSNAQLIRSAKSPSVFKEVYKTVHAKASMEGFTQEQILGESIAQYTVLETLNAIELLGRSKEQIIQECIDKRRKLVK